MINDLSGKGAVTNWLEEDKATTDYAMLLKIV